MNKDLRNFQEELDKALVGLDIPAQRRKLTLTNLQWLSRNLAIRNEGQGLKEANKVVINLLKHRKLIGL